MYQYLQILNITPICEGSNTTKINLEQSIMSDSFGGDKTDTGAYKIIIGLSDYQPGRYLFGT